MTENGFAVMNEKNMPIDQAVEDTDRVEYFRGNCEALLAAITEDGVDIRSYFGWSEFDFSHRIGVTLLIACLPRSVGQLRMVGHFFTPFATFRKPYSTSRLTGLTGTQRDSALRTWITRPRNDIQKSPANSFRR